MSEANEYVPIGRAEIEACTDSGVLLKSGSTRVEVTALAPDLWRVGMFGQGRTPRYSTEAIARTQWDPVPFEYSEGDGAITLSAASGIATVALDPLRIQFSDGNGRTFASDDPDKGMGTVAGSPGEPWAAPVGPAVRVYKRHALTERYFGCGERTSGLEKTDSHQIFWNIDPPIGHTASLSNLYTSIPFLLALDEGNAWGLLFDNTHRVEFDLASDDPDTACFAGDGGDLIYYVFCGPSPRAVLSRYTELTGRTPMPPLWSLGYQQSKYSYMDAVELKEIARSFRERDIPCDTLYLDIDYMDGYRVFTWDHGRFPDPSKLLSELAADGFHVVTIIDPGVKVDEDYSVYSEGRRADLFCATLHGDEYHNVVWPGMCAWPDFTSSKVRTWWGDNHRSLIDAGVAGIWCDMNEPCVFVPLQDTFPGDVVHKGDGDAKVHAQIHNAYGSLMARATREGLERLQPERRPFVITRAGYAGVQRHALQWTGDNSAWWEHLAMSLPQLQNLGLSGVAWAGSDIGGFHGDSNGELLARWTEMGVFQPFCRNHNAKGFRPQEPWSFGEPFESVCRKMIKLRQRLLPYLYSAFEECHRTGAPILRPLLFEYPGDATTYTVDDEFLLGDSLLVAPITKPGVEHRHVYLPEGAWWHLWTGERSVGPAHILVHAPLGKPALFVAANKPIAMGPEMNHVGERAGDPLTVMTFVDEGRGESVLYEDAGEGYTYRDGEYARTRMVCEGSGGSVNVSIGDREGAFVPERSEMRLELRGLGEPPDAVELDHRVVAHAWDPATDTLTVAMDDDGAGHRLNVTRGRAV
ncbi:MAG: glycoside hydrolase family 31 protein [Actinomycetota bacterium]|nr:glycoside hydrolase family 31 protein [Actinomycetota bacterium]